MAKPRVSPDVLEALTTAIAKEKETGAVKRKEASPKSSLTERQSIRPARTSIAHQRGGNKGK